MILPIVQCVNNREIETMVARLRRGENARINPTFSIKLKGHEMIVNKETGKYYSSVLGTLGDEHNWKSGDEIWVNRKYQLVFTSDLVKGKYAVKQFYGFEIQYALANLYSMFDGDMDKIINYRRAVLGSLVEAWGRKVFKLDKAEHHSREFSNLVKSALKNHKKAKSTLNTYLAMYVALHIDDMDSEALTVHVGDFHNVEPMSLEEFQECTSENLRQCMTYDEHCSNTRTIGALSIAYPQIDELTEFMCH